MASTLLAVDRAQTLIRAAGNRKPLYMAPFGFSAQQHFHGHRSGFNGEGVDPATGHYPLGNGYRHYGPALMRFNSPDRLSPFDQGGLNSYAYCQGDPLNWRDPGGQRRLGIGSRITRKRVRAQIPENLFSPPAAAARWQLTETQIVTVTYTPTWRIQYSRQALAIVAGRIARYALARYARRKISVPAAPSVDIAPRRRRPPEQGAAGRRPSGPPATAAAQSRSLPWRVLMAAGRHASGDEPSAAPEGSLAQRQLRIRQG